MTRVGTSTDQCLVDPVLNFEPNMSQVLRHSSEIVAATTARSGHLGRSGVALVCLRWSLRSEVATVSRVSLVKTPFFGKP